MESSKAFDQAKESSPTENFSVSFAPTAETQRSARHEMTMLAGDSKEFLPKLQLDFTATLPAEINATKSSDKPQSLIVKEAVSAYKENGPAATLELLREDLAAFEKDKTLTYKLSAERGGAGFDDETASKLAQEKSAERWQAIKNALLEQDPHAIEKLKVAYLDNTLKAMSAAGNRYGSLDQYGVSGQAHFENQKSNGSSPMIRELSSQISKEYGSIADPSGRDVDSSRIDKRELEQYKAKQALSWK